MAEESKDCCLPEVCEATKYVKPEYIKEQEERLQMEAYEKCKLQQCLCDEEKMAKFEKKWGTCYKPYGYCASGLCGCDY